jgi:hypothetical protein
LAQDPDSFLVADCTDTNFEIPTGENCDCEIYYPSDTPGGFESCKACSFVGSVDAIAIAYDCSNLLSGSCVGRDSSNTCISHVPFETTGELRDAVDVYLADNSTASTVGLLASGMYPRFKTLASSSQRM